MSTQDYADYILDLLEPLGNIKVRKMFGGFGFYKDTVFFALIATNVLYFKVGDNNRSFYEARGSKPFCYERENGKTVSMSYWEVPIDVLEDRDILTEWVYQAVIAARLTKKPTKKKTTKNQVL